MIANLAMSPECHATILAARALPALLALVAKKNTPEHPSEDRASASGQTRLLVAGALANLMGEDVLPSSLSFSLSFYRS